MRRQSPILFRVLAVPKLHTLTCKMKGTKVLTLGAGREVLPHNMAVTKMYIDADDIYTRSTHAIYVHLRMRGTVNWWAGWSVLLTRGLLPAC